MKTEILNNIVTRLENVGLNRHHLKDSPNLHHYVIELNYKKSDEDNIMNELPTGFESVCENEYKDGTCDGTFMFYLEDINENQANEIINWLKKNNKIWTNTDVPQCVR